MVIQPASARDVLTRNRWTHLGGLVGGLWMMPLLATTEFDSAFMQFGGLLPLHAEDTLPPGRYALDVQLNERHLGRHQIRFALNDQGRLQPCLDADLLPALPLRVDALPATGQTLLATPPTATTCASLQTLHPQIDWQYESESLTLQLHVPQALLRSVRMRALATEQLDPGIPALRLDYQTNLYRYQTATTQQHQGFASLQGGGNLGHWRLRQRATLRQSSGEATHWQPQETTLQRSLPAWQGQLTLGETSSRSDLFDSMRYRGLQLRTDRRMLDPLQSSFAPVVQGQAETRALVSVHQLGRLIYQTTVAPGPFLIEDLPALGSSNDLTVTVQESDGRQQQYTLPAQSLPQLLRPGRVDYNLTLGQLDSDRPDSDPHPWWLEADWQQGLNNRLTLYAGSQLSPDYQAWLVGSAWNTRWGGLAVDLTRAEDAHHSASYAQRLRWSQPVGDHNGRLTLTAWQALSNHYRTLTQTLRHDASHPANQTVRQRVSLHLGQPLPGYGGSLYLSANWQRDGQPQHTWSGQAGYQHYWRRLGYGLSAGRTRDASGDQQYQLQLSLNLLLGPRAQGQSLSWLSSHDSAAGTRHQTFWRAPMPDWPRVNLSLNAGQSGEQRTLGGSVHWLGQPVELDASASADNQQQRQLSFGAAGTLLAHRTGVHWSRPAGETLAIITAEGAQGASLYHWPEIRLDRQGQAVVPHLAPFRDNPLALQAEGMADDVELLHAQRSALPDAGAILHLSFPTRRGRPLLLPAAMVDGSPLPMGASIQDADCEEWGLVAQGSQLYTRLARTPATLQVVWGPADHQRCQVEISDTVATAALTTGPLPCHPLPPSGDV